MRQLLMLLSALLLLSAVACTTTATDDPQDTSPAVDSSVQVDTPVQTDVGFDSVEPNESPIGDPCSVDGGECDGGICATLLPGGYCTMGCDGVACPSGAECRLLNDFPFCMKTCASTEECRADEDYACLGGVCNIACQNVFDCSKNQLCVQGVCEDIVPDRILGAICDSSSQCISGSCLAPADGGVCSEPCIGDTCSLEGWSCHALTPLDATGPLSLCGPGGIFDTTVMELTGDGTYSFSVSTDIVSFLIVVEGSSPGGVMVVDNLRRPDGSVAAGKITDNGFTEPFRISPSYGHASVMFPNNADPALQVVPGVWTFDAYGDLGQYIDRVRVFLKRRVGEGDVASTSFDLNIYIPTGLVTGFSAASAPNDSHMQSALNRLRDMYWGKVQVGLGTVRYFDIANTYVNVADYPELTAMFASQTEGKPEALNVFLTRDLFAGEAAGISGGIPGPVGVPGSGGSGVCVQLQGRSTETGDNITHELGHFLSLYHPTETFGVMHDVIEDTAKCRTPFQMTQYESCMDTIMYPILMTGYVDQSLSPTQGNIMRLNPRGN